jgi:hypothetical protein
MLSSPNPDAAHQYAVILSSGMPSSEAIRYFLPEDVQTEAEILAFHDKWMTRNDVRQAIITLQGKPWQEMTLEEMISFTLDKTYKEAAYFLYSHNYAEVIGAEKTKMDDCRKILELKLAGMSGKMTALDQFYSDLKNGLVGLGQPIARLH